MRKQTKIGLLVVAGIVLLWGLLVLAEYIRFRNNKDPFNSNGFRVVNETELCYEALELFYEDENFKYYFSCIQSGTTFVLFDNNKKYTIKEAVNNGLLTITEIMAKIDVMAEPRIIIYKYAKDLSM